MRRVFPFVAVLAVGLAAGWAAGRSGLEPVDASAEAAVMMPVTEAVASVEVVAPQSGPAQPVASEGASVTAPPASTSLGSAKVAPNTVTGPKWRPDEEMYSFRGFVFRDLNGNDARDREEPVLGGIWVTIPGSGIAAMSGDDGRWELCCFREGVYRIAAEDASVTVDTEKARHPVIEPLNLGLP
ncbi:MAG: hypothetical protein HYY05_04630 [Chloroflexi bacterium]|nr:hypothetical protein [Chloroflexota bacterium]